MNQKPRIYLDNAATSWPKPEVVYKAVDRYQREIGASAGRGAYTHAQQAQRVVDQARTACAQLLGVANPDQIVLTSNGTDALNLAIHGLLQPGDHVVATVCEHNSILRPLEVQTRCHGVTVSYAKCDQAGYVTPEEVASRMQPNTRLVAVLHASNVTGAIQPIDKIAPVVHQHNALLLVDAAQTAGCVPIDVTQLDVDLLATGGHKSLLGPGGTGLLYVRPGLENVLQPIRQGGTGTDSLTESQPAELPTRFEAGSLNIPALAGLIAASTFLQQQGVASIHKHVSDRTTQLIDGLAAIQGIELFGPRTDRPRAAVVSFAAHGYDPQEFAAALDASAGIQSRAGLHCAPRMHAALGTVERGGLVRLSAGWSTTSKEIATALQQIESLAGATSEV